MYNYNRLNFMFKVIVMFIYEQQKVNVIYSDKLSIPIESIVYV